MAPQHQAHGPEAPRLLPAEGGVVAGADHIFLVTRPVGAKGDPAHSAGQSQKRLLQRPQVVHRRRHVAVAVLKPRHHPGLGAERDQRLVAPLARNHPLRRLVGVQAFALAGRDDRRIEVDGHRPRTGLPHAFGHQTPPDLPEQLVAFAVRRDERLALLALYVMHARDMKAVQPVARRARRGKAALPSAPEAPGERAPRQAEQLRLEAPDQRTKTRIALQTVDVRHPVEPRDVEKQDGQDHLTVAPALRRAAFRPRQSGQNARRRQQLQEHHRPPSAVAGVPSRATSSLTGER